MIYDSEEIEAGVHAHRRFHGEGHEARLSDQLIEEMAELTKELLKKRRGKGSDFRITEEMADVLVCLEYLGRALGIEAVDMARLVDACSAKVRQEAGRLIALRGG